MKSGRVLRTVCVVSAVLALYAAEGCSRRVTVPVVTTPRYPDFMFPAVPSGLGDPAALADHDLAWRLLQIGDLRGAERGFTARGRCRAPPMIWIHWLKSRSPTFSGRTAF